MKLKKYLILIFAIIMTISAASITTLSNDDDKQANGFPYDKWIWIGDSRTVGMQIVTGADAYAQVGARCVELEQTFDLINGLRGYNIIFNLGINDLGTGSNAPSDNAVLDYIDVINQFSDEFLTKNNVCYMSVNPADGSYAKLNPRIEDFNTELWRLLPKGWTYLDTYSWMMQNGFETIDGLHFSDSTYQALYDAVTNYDTYTQLIKPLPYKSNILSKTEDKLQEYLNNRSSLISKVYLSDNAIIFLKEHDQNNDYFQSNYVLADIYLNDVHELKTYYQDDPENGFSEVAEIDQISDHVWALLSCNGDFYAVENEDKEVLRNGKSILALEESGNRDYCVINNDGSMDTIRHQDAIENPNLLSQMRENAWQIWSFGPILLNENGKAIENFDDCHNPKIIGPNPRTAIGYFEPNHFCILMVSGRVNNNKGATLQELSKFFESVGCKKAYNLDGGGTSHFWYEGKNLGDPCEPRKISDIIYIEYQLSSDNYKNDLTAFKYSLKGIHAIAEHKDNFV